MNRERRDLLSIGNFSDAAQLSLKALRLYDQLGLLRPAYTDPASGYRYYRTEQLDTARLIRMMRQMDMPLATIRRVLAAAPSDAEALVIEHWQDLQQRMETARVTVQDLICTLRGASETMTLPTLWHIEVRSLPDTSLVSLTSHVTIKGLDAAIIDCVAALEVYVRQQGATVNGLPFGIFHGAINQESDGPIEICVPTSRLLTGKEEIKARMVTGGEAAFVSLKDGQCAFPEVLKGYDALVDWMRQNGCEPAGPPREEWAHLPDIESQMDVYWMFREKKA